MTTVDKTTASDAEFRARIAGFDGVAAPESFRPLPGEVEMHRAMNATPEQVDRIRAALGAAPLAGQRTTDEEG